MITDDKKKEWIVIQIHDDGKGILDTEGLCEVKPNNTSWGLVNACRVVRNHGGEIIFKSKSDGVKGFLIEIKLNKKENSYKYFDAKKEELK